jgi:hypothetical protein
MDTCATCVYTLVKYRTVALFCLVFDDVSLLCLWWSVHIWCRVQILLYISYVLFLLFDFLNYV